MQRSAFALVLCLGFSGWALASEDAEWAKAMEIPCHATLTESECRAHHDLLARLPKGPEREAYLSEHYALIEDRSQACGCNRNQNNVGLLN
jgi:hypothetical protein